MRRFLYCWFIFRWINYSKAFLSAPTDGRRSFTSLSQKTDPTEEFLTSLEESFTSASFQGLELYGPSKKTLKNLDDTHETTRGLIRQVSTRPVQLKRKQQIQVTVKYHLATDIVKNWSYQEAPSKLDNLCKFLLTQSMEMNQDFASEWGSNIRLSGPGMHSAVLQTNTTEYALSGINGKSPKFSRRKLKSVDSNIQNHDRTKVVPIPSSQPFLQALGVVQANGQPRKKAKLRQIQVFCRVVYQHLQSLKVSENMEQTVEVIDMGCGRGYLTFSLHYYLAQQLASVRSIGMDVRPKLMNEMNKIAQSLDGFEGLDFRTGTIESYLDEDSEDVSSTDGPLRVLIALHACDTATDDAIWAGIQRNAQLIVVAPCCHKQIRRQLDAHYSRTKESHPLSSIWKHAIYRERAAETVTDVLRALLLECSGYRVQNFEFVSPEDTSKNIMITAVKTNARVRSGLESEIRSLAAFHGIHSMKLAEWMNFDLSLPENDKNNIEPPIMVGRRMA